MSQPQQLSSSTSSPPLAPSFRERKSTNKYTQKNNRYRDRLRTTEGYKLAIVKAKTANNTYISKAKAAVLRAKEVELLNLPEENQRLAKVEIGRRCRQHSVLSMYV